MGFSRNDATQLPLVSICSITYNHEPYIRQCLDGFLMQKTNFKYEIIIHDDASTDGTAEVIKEYAEKYPNLIIPIFQTENQYSKGLRGFYARFIYPIAKGKYIAICEGDDYWTDPYKLQKQVDFLEANLEYGLVYTDYSRLNKDNLEYACILNGKTRKINSYEEMLQYAGFIVPCSWLFRKSIYERLDKIENVVDGSFVLALGFFMKSKIAFINEVTCVYRFLPESASHSRFLEKSYKYVKGILFIQEFFFHKYGNVTYSIYDLLANNYMLIFPKAIALGDKEMVNKIRSLLIHRLTIKRFLLIVLSYLPIMSYLFKFIYKKRGFKVI